MCCCLSHIFFIDEVTYVKTKPSKSVSKSLTLPKVNPMKKITGSSIDFAFLFLNWIFRNNTAASEVAGSPPPVDKQQQVIQKKRKGNLNFLVFRNISKLIFSQILQFRKEQTTGNVPGKKLNLMLWGLHHQRSVFLLILLVYSFCFQGSQPLTSQSAQPQVGQLSAADLASIFKTVLTESPRSKVDSSELQQAKETIKDQQEKVCAIFLVKFLS